jgi:quercetin 2,3-dioxygenase
MFAPRRGNGQDFNPNQAYRMYHGDRIPGFPQHPHRGFETVTATMGIFPIFLLTFSYPPFLEGLIDHTDSLGNGGRYGQGDLQWMTAGSGVVHGEMFPLINSDRPNPCRFFQIWLNLPSKSKMVPPDFAMVIEREHLLYHNISIHLQVFRLCGRVYVWQSISSSP